MSPFLHQTKDSAASNSDLQILPRDYEFELVKHSPLSLHRPVLLQVLPPVLKRDVNSSRQKSGLARRNLGIASCSKLESVPVTVESDSESER